MLFVAMKDKRIGVVGLGRMGANMARRMKDCGYQVSEVFDVAEEVATSLAEEIGANAAGSLSSLAAGSDVVLTVVTDDAAMDSIFFGEDNLFADASGKVFLNCATVTPGIHRKLDAAAKERGAVSLEACMASSIPQARNGDLYLMIGGDQATFESIKPLLDDLSKKLLYIGEAGKAAEVKALVNMVMNINTAALAEGLGLGQALGLDLRMLVEVFSETGANSRVLETDSDDMIDRDHECYFSAAHAAKDSGIALDLGNEQSIDMPLAQATLDQFRKMIELGIGELDKSGVAELTFPGRGKG